MFVFLISVKDLERPARGTSLDLTTLTILCGAWGSVVAKALLYKSEGLGIDSKR